LINHILNKFVRTTKEIQMFKAIKEFFIGKPVEAPKVEDKVAAVNAAPYKVEAPVAPVAEKPAKKPAAKKPAAPKAKAPAKKAAKPAAKKPAAKAKKVTK
jgi:hypothetical protein